jgi:aspartyl-tRNA(Asn)/glutamyl-tRNA(Gln) amidotransferase subunit A
MLLSNDENLTIAKLAPLLRRRKVSPVELTEYFLGRIARFQPSLNAFITLTAELARKQARQAEKEILKGRYRGPLHGLPISLKDLFWTAGVRTTAGSKILRRFAPRENAIVVNRLLTAGSILLGKTNLHEFAFGVTSVNPHYGPVHNPWDLRRISGGSSGGSAAAVSAGLCVASLGTDTGGSIRIPSAACGVVGLKPTRGLVPLQGVIPLAFSLDHVGPICRCVEDAALILEMIAGHDPLQSDHFHRRLVFSRPLRRGVRGIRVGIPKQYFFDRLQGDIRHSVLAACSTLEKLGARLQEVELRGMRQAGELAATITVGEALAFHWKWLQTRAKDYGADLRERMKLNHGQRTVEYLQAQQRRRAYRERFLQAFESVDVLAAPTLPVVTPLIGQKEIHFGRTREDVRGALLRLTRPGNLTGLPAISLPCGFSQENLPIGLQLFGRLFDEATLLRVACAYEQATPWHKMFPPDPECSS